MAFAKIPECITTKDDTRHFPTPCPQKMHCESFPTFQPWGSAKHFPCNSNTTFRLLADQVFHSLMSSTVHSQIHPDFKCSRNTTPALESYASSMVFQMKLRSRKSTTILTDPGRCMHFWILWFAFATVQGCPVLSNCLWFWCGGVCYSVLFLWFDHIWP